MASIRRIRAWVVYRKTVGGNAAANAVCEQAEWDAMEADRPGYHTLIRDQIWNEGEAERVARGTSGDPPVRASRRERV